MEKLPIAPQKFGSALFEYLGNTVCMCLYACPLVMLLSGHQMALKPEKLQPCMAEAYFNQLGNIPCDAYSEDQYCFIFEVSNIDEEAVGEQMFLWDLGNGKYQSGGSIEYCYEDYGTYQVTLFAKRVVEEVALVDTSYYEVEINNVVVINEESPEAQSQGHLYYFDATGSFIDNDVEPIGYYWSFGDGNYGCTELAKNVYATPGEYLVKLMIRGRAENGEERIICGQKQVNVQ